MNEMLQRSPMVLLTGPAGAGKSALVQVLAKELNCELKEWSNPIAATYDELSFLDRRNNWSGTVLSLGLFFIKMDKSMKSIYTVYMYIWGMK